MQPRRTRDAAMVDARHGVRDRWSRSFRGTPHTKKGYRSASTPSVRERGGTASVAVSIDVPHVVQRRQIARSDPQDVIPQRATTVCIDAIACCAVHRPARSIRRANATNSVFVITGNRSSRFVVVTVAIDDRGARRGRRWRCITLPIDPTPGVRHALDSYTALGARSATGDSSRSRIRRYTPKIRADTAAETRRAATPREDARRRRPQFGDT